MLFITFYEKEPIFDILPVHGTRFFKENRKQLLYARIAFVEGEGFCFDLMKFERAPAVVENGVLSEADSLSVVSFDFSANNIGPVFTALLNVEGRNAVYLDGHSEKSYSLSNVFTYGGEDEQGWYWGVRFEIGLCLLSSIYGIADYSPEDTVRGNIYAVLNEGPNAHFGAISHFEEPSVFSKSNFTEFQIKRRWGG